MKSKSAYHLDPEMWADVQDMASRLEEMLHTAPENFYYMKGCIHCLAAKNELSGADPAYTEGVPDRCPCIRVSRV